MGRIFAFGCLGIVGLFIVLMIVGWTAFVQPFISSFMPGLFDIAYTTDTAIVHVPLRGPESGQTIAVVNLPAAYVPSATHREGKTPTTILPIELSFPDLGPATQAPAIARSARLERALLRSWTALPGPAIRLMCPGQKVRSFFAAQVLKRTKVSAVFTFYYT